MLIWCPTDEASSVHGPKIFTYISNVDDVPSAGAAQSRQIQQLTIVLAFAFLPSWLRDPLYFAVSTDDGFLESLLDVRYLSMSQVRCRQHGRDTLSGYSSRINNAHRVSMLSCILQYLCQRGCLTSFAEDSTDIIMVMVHTH